MTSADHDAVGEEHILAHARCLRDWVVGHQPHEQCADRGGNAGGNKHGTKVHSGCRQNGWIGHRYVDHSEEGCEARNKLALHA